MLKESYPVDFGEMFEIHWELFDLDNIQKGQDMIGGD